VSYIVIDSDGQLHHHTARVTAEAIRAEMPSQHFDLVRLRREPNLFGFVDDSGHLIGLPRNPAGSCVLVALGASPHAYCGPVVITGWSEPDESSELRDLDPDQRYRVTQLHSSVDRVLAGDVDVLDDRWVLDSPQILAYADWVRDSPPPVTTVIPLGGEL
jgi:hypothetical protein